MILGFFYFSYLFLNGFRWIFNKFNANFIWFVFVNLTVLFVYVKYFVWLIKNVLLSKGINSFCGDKILQINLLTSFFVRLFVYYWNRVRNKARILICKYLWPYKFYIDIFFFSINMFIIFSFNSKCIYFCN